MDRAEVTMLILRSLLLGRGEWSPQLRQSQRSKETSIAFHGSGDGGLLFAISEVLRGRRVFPRDGLGNTRPNQACR